MKNSSRNNSKQPKPADYERLGRLMTDVFEAGYFNKKRLYKIALLRGVLTGLGGAIGATIVFAVLLWVLSLFDSLPLIGDLIEKVENSR